MKNASWSLFFIFAASLTSLESMAQVRPLPSYDESRQPRDERRPEERQPRDPRQPQQPIPQTNYPQPFPQYDERGQEEAIEARIQQSLSRGSRIRLSQYLYARDSRAEIISLTITAQSFGPRGGSLQLLSRGQVVENLQTGRQLMQLQVRAIDLGLLEDLELSSLDDVYIESISARLSSRRPGPGGGWGNQRELPVAANSLISLRVNQDFLRGGEIQIERLVREQLGQTLQGAQINRIAVEGSPIGYGLASVQVELNGRLAGTSRQLNAGQRMHPIQVQSFEEVRTLKLLVLGSARIMDINIRIGDVRPQGPQFPQGPGPQFPSSSRIFVNQEISPSYPLDLALFSREFALVRSITLETTVRGYAAGELTLMSRQGHIIGRALIAQGRTLVLLTIPTAAADIRIFTQAPVQVASIELELERQIGRR